jgi:glycogen debranching enzyme
MPVPPFIFPLAENRADIRCAWRGPSLLVVRPDGTAGGHRLSGFFFRQTRFLRALRLRVNGEAPLACSCAEVAPNELELTYLFPEVDRGGGGGSGSGGLADRDGLLYRDLDFRLRYRVGPASLQAKAVIASRWQDVEIDLAWELSADYASVDEAHFDRREQEAAVTAHPQADGRLVLRYTHPDLPFETRIDAGGAAWSATAGGFTARLPLRRQEPAELTLCVRAVDFEDPIDAEGESRREERLRQWEGGVVELFTPGETPLVEITHRAMRDLGSFARLEGPASEWLTPAAGVPLYLTLWGRDALTVGWQAGLFDRGEMLADVLSCMDRLRGRELAPERDEEPGRIINQAKLDPLSRLGRTPFRRYYADFASPFMFIIGLGNLYALSGDREAVAGHWEAALGVLEWARQHADRDGDGYLEYLTRSPHGPRHQGWKDSENAVVGADGRQVEPPIAPCEVQGYYYVSLQFMAVLSAVMGERDRGLALWKEAHALKERFNRDFWLEEEGFLAFGLDAEKRPIAALTSNAAHCLPTGIVSTDHIPRLVRRLFEPDLFSGWGIRTLSAGNPAYNPLDYHLGSVWPVENATILFGLRRYGLEDQALQLARAMYDLARLWPGGRVPECVGGYARGELGHPGTYPPANWPQAWNQSVFPLLVQSLLGIVPCAPLRLLVVDPLLPPWLPELTVRRLRVGEAAVTLRFYRDGGGESHYEVVEQQGELRVAHQPWMESFSADRWERLAGLAETLVPVLR